MSEQKKKIERLELNMETVQDLTESEAEGAEGGLMLQCGSHHQCPTKGCPTKTCPTWEAGCDWDAALAL